MTDTKLAHQAPLPLEPGSEVTVTVTGRVIHHNSDAVVIEYVKANGFTERIAVRNGADVEFRLAEPPNRETLAARERAARMVAVACLDLEAKAWTGTEWVARWNDAYPPGTRVRYWLGERDDRHVDTAVRDPARLLGGHTAAVWLEFGAGAVWLDHVEPIAEES